MVIVSNEELLKVALLTAVPLWIERVKPWDWERRLARAEQAVDVIASEGDNILHRSREQGESAKAFNALAEALAILAYQPGGVEFAGMHWEVVPSQE